MTTIYQQLGEVAGIRRAVDAFYERLQADAQLAHHFADVDMARLRRHQAALLCAITGGPIGYDGLELAEAHAHLTITDRDFTRVAGHLVAVLEEAWVERNAVSAVVATLSTHREEIVTEPAAAAARAAARPGRECGGERGGDRRRAAAGELRRGRGAR